MRITALAASACGNWCTKSAELVCLSAPKSITAMAGLLPPDLYIRADLAVIDDEDQVTSLKSRNAVVPDDVGLAAIVRVFPPAV